MNHDVDRHPSPHPDDERHCSTARSGSEEPGVPARTDADPEDGAWLEGIEAHHLRQLITTLPVIEQAKGILMGYYAIGPDQAFTLLRRWSSSRNIKLRLVCHAVVTAARQHHAEPFGGLREYLNVDSAWPQPHDEERPDDEERPHDE